MMAEGHSPNGTNRLQNAMPPEFRERISANLERVSLGLHDMVYEPLQPIEYVYFPLNGVISMLADMEEENLVEVARATLRALAADDARPRRR